MIFDVDPWEWQGHRPVLCAASDGCNPASIVTSGDVHVTIISKPAGLELVCSTKALKTSQLT